MMSEGVETTITIKNNLIHKLHTTTSTIKFCGGFALKRKKWRPLFSSYHILVHGLDPLPLPQCCGSHILVHESLKFLQYNVLIILIAII
jgi:hypothetical protein